MNEVNEMLNNFGKQLSEALLPIILIAGVFDLIIVLIKKKMKKSLSQKGKK